jgi:hypothetical protein
MMEQQNKDSLPFTDSNKGKTRLRFDTQTLKEMYECLTDNGEVKILPAKEWQKWGKNNLGAFLTCNNIWTVPTLELCDILDDEIGDLSCIEICAGRGIISKELNIRATDSYLKASEEYINALGQNENMQYPSFVEKLEASEAVDKYHPECVLSCYGVPRWDEETAKRYYLDTGKELRGSVKGVDYEYILSKIKKLILVGHKELYCQHPFFKRKHRLIVNKNVLTRHSVNGQSYIYIFEKK